MIPARKLLGLTLQRFLWLSKASFDKGLKVFILTFLMVGIVVDNVQILMNHTPSLPYRYFLHFPKRTPRKNDLTVFEHPSGKCLLKKIIGSEGDRLFYDKEGCLWVGKTKVGAAKRVNRQGEMLIKIPAGVIPKGYVFLYAPHEESLDSRYTQVGLIYEKHLQGRAYGIV